MFQGRDTGRGHGGDMIVLRGRDTERDHGGDVIMFRDVIRDVVTAET